MYTIDKIKKQLFCKATDTGPDFWMQPEIKFLERPVLHFHSAPSHYKEVIVTFNIQMDAVCADSDVDEVLTQMAIKIFDTLYGELLNELGKLEAVIVYGKQKEAKVLIQKLLKNLRPVK